MFNEDHSQVYTTALAHSTARNTRAVSETHFTKLAINLKCLFLWFNKIKEDNAIMSGHKEVILAKHLIGSLS